LDIVAFGDSIVWGQGLKEEDKFTSLVKSRLEARGFASTLVSYAHSGAILAPAGRDGDSPYWGEVPESAPSVAAQVEAAAKELTAANVGLVFLNGGINDVSPVHIVVGDPFDPLHLERLRSQTIEVYTKYFGPLLEQVTDTFSNAVVVVTSYYPMVSDHTDASDLASLMKHLPRPNGLRNFIDETVEHLADDLIEVAIRAERDRMVEQCSLFDSLSKELIETSIRAGGVDRVVHAPVQFAPENAFAAGSTWLWCGSDDPLHPERLNRYAEQLKTDPFAWPFVTPIASICHPNQAGALAYADAIMSALEKTKLLKL
jgi:hypothetical protein